MSKVILTIGALVAISMVSGDRLAGTITDESAGSFIELDGSRLVRLANVESIELVSSEKAAEIEVRRAKRGTGEDIGDAMQKLMCTLDPGMAPLFEQAGEVAQANLEPAPSAEELAALIDDSEPSRVPDDSAEANPASEATPHESSE